MKPVALTLGDPSGIGGELALQAWTALHQEVPMALIGGFDHVAGLAAPSGIPVRRIHRIEEAAGQCSEALPVLDVQLPHAAPAGRPDPRNAAATVECIRLGVELVRSGAALALTTNPINKNQLRTGAGFAFPGHTEYLARLCDAPLAVMMLASPLLRVVPVTIHIPLAEVPRALTADLLEQTIRVTAASLRVDFGFAAPRIAVAGLNPHAGEEGMLGTEDRDIIAPVVARLRAEGHVVTGPHSADTMFHPAARATCDVAICMYHDQALIPIKTLDFDGGVNVTLGLDFVRTSPDHGTAYDIAGTGRANPSSLIAALRLARDMGLRRGAGT